MTQIKSQESPYVVAICNLSVMNQLLLSKSLDLGLLEDAARLKAIDEQLVCLLHKGVVFEFVSAIAEGKTLLVGESNLSFSASLSRKKRITSANLTATTFEKSQELSEEAKKNVELLKSLGALVLHDVNAANLSRTFGSMKFDSIIFQFPHAGSREPIEGRNPNFILVRDFLRSAKRQLRLGGKVLISAVDSPHYHGAFQFEEAAKVSGFKAPEIHPFDPASFPGYVHNMTHDDGSAIDEHKTFSTWVFRI